MLTSSHEKWLNELWDEWSSSPVRQADYEISGLLLGMRHNAETFTTTRIKTARRLTLLWKASSYVKSYQLQISMLTRPDKKARIMFTCPEKILKKPRRDTLWSWLKGLWGSSGALYFPKYGYCLTLRIPDEEKLRLTGLTWTKHRNEYLLRNHEDIMTFLYNADMISSALEFETFSMIRSARSRANIQSNYDTANIKRSVKASQHQRDLSEKILTSGVEIPERLRKIAELRLKYPEESLSSLGQRLNPPVSKSTVNYYWKKLENFLR